jgi:hypothetical protein
MMALAASSPKRATPLLNTRSSLDHVATPGAFNAMAAESKWYSDFRLAAVSVRMFFKLGPFRGIVSFSSSLKMIITDRRKEGERSCGGNLKWKDGSIYLEPLHLVMVRTYRIGCVRLRGVLLYPTVPFLITSEGKIPVGLSAVGRDSRRGNVGPGGSGPSSNIPERGDVRHQSGFFGFGSLSRNTIRPDTGTASSTISKPFPSLWRKPAPILDHEESGSPCFSKFLTAYAMCVGLFAMLPPCGFG